MTADLQTTWNEATEVPQRREPVFFFTERHQSQTSVLSGYSLTFLRDYVPGIWRPLRGLRRFAVLLRPLRGLRAQQMPNKGHVSLIIVIRCNGQMAE